MTTNYYVRHLDHSSSEQLCLNVYNFLNSSNEMPEKIYVVEHVRLKQKYKDILNKLINMTYIDPDKFLNIYSNCSTPVEITSTIKTSNIIVPQNKSNIDTAIVLYIYYPELLREFVEYMNKFATYHSIDVYLYVCDKIPIKTIQDITNSYNITNINYYYEHVPNRGRDILSFLLFIQSKKYKKYKYICKLHTKNTTYLDPNWRSNYLKYLLDINIYDTTIRPSLDSTQPSIKSYEKYRLIENYNELNYNYKSMSILNENLKLNMYKHTRYEFVAGTMFWVNNLYCNFINKLIYDVDLVDMFEVEPIRGDGAIAHAWERLFYIISV